MERTVVMYHDSPLGRWVRALYFPARPLAEHVQMLWYVSGRANYARDRRLPTGNAHLLFNLGSPPLLFERKPPGATRRFPTAWIAGQSSTYIETGSHGDTALLGAQFRCHGAWRLLRIAQDELADQVVELEAVCGDRIAGLHQQLLDAQSPQSCFALLEAWLTGLLDRDTRVHAGVVAVSHALQTSHGRADLRHASRSTGYSREYLIRRFREQVGLTPKAYAGILRFNRALAVAHGARAGWAEIAHDCGYYDQAHLIRDFQRFAGRAPGNLLHDRRPDADSIVVG